MNTIKRKCSCGKMLEFSLEKREVKCRHIEGGKIVTVTHTYIPSGSKHNKPGRGYAKRGFRVGRHGKPRWVGAA